MFKNVFMKTPNFYLMYIMFQKMFQADGDEVQTELCWFVDLVV